MIYNNQFDFVVIMGQNSYDHYIVIKADLRQAYYNYSN